MILLIKKLIKIISKLPLGFNKNLFVFILIIVFSSNLILANKNNLYQIIPEELAENIALNLIKLFTAKEFKVIDIRLLRDIDNNPAVYVLTMADINSKFNLKNVNMDDNKIEFLNNDFQNEIATIYIGATTLYAPFIKWHYGFADFFKNITYASEKISELHLCNKSLSYDNIIYLNEFYQYYLLSCSPDDFMMNVSNFNLVKKKDFKKNSKREINFEKFNKIISAWDSIIDLKNIKNFKNGTKLNLNFSLEKENYIPGSSPTDNIKSVPVFQNKPDRYGIQCWAAKGGICASTAVASILGYWENNEYNSIRYWNLIKHGSAPLIDVEDDPKKCDAFNYGSGYFYELINFHANCFYCGFPFGKIDECLKNFTNSIRGNNFEVIWVSWPTSNEELFAQSILEIDSGRPLLWYLNSITDPNTNAKGAHMMPMIGYKDFTGTSLDQAYVHENMGDLDSVFINWYGGDSYEADTKGIFKIIPGGLPNDT